MLPMQLEWFLYYCNRLWDMRINILRTKSFTREERPVDAWSDNHLLSATRTKNYPFILSGRK